MLGEGGLRQELYKENLSRELHEVSSIKLAARNVVYQINVEG